MKEQYGMAAVLAQADGHAETKVVHAAHGCNRALLGLLGGYTLQERNPDSWEGWYWGAKHVWGCEPVGKGAYQSNLVPDIAEHTQTLIYAGCDPETTTWGWGGQTVSPALLLVLRARHQADLHLAPTSTTARRRARRQVDPHPARHRRRPLPGHRVPVAAGGHLRQGVC